LAPTISRHFVVSPLGCIALPTNAVPEGEGAEEVTLLLMMLEDRTVLEEAGTGELEGVTVPALSALMRSAALSACFYVVSFLP